MKIGYFSSTYFPTPDGVSHYLRDVKSELENMGHEVHIFSFNGDRKEKNVHVTRSFPLPMYTQYSVPFFPIPVALYRKALEERFDVIHIHDPFIGTLGYRVAKNQNIPIFSTFHTDFVRMQESINLPMKSRLFSFTWRYNLYLYRKCIKVFVPSGKSKRYLEEFGIHNTVELPLFVDTEKFSQLSESENPGEKFIVQFLGRITRDKGAFRLLDIASRIPESEGINFVISGTGPDEELLRKQVKERGLENRIEITGYVNENRKLELLSRSSLFIYPASADTFGISALEALSFGVPTIVSKDFPLLEYSDGHSGLISLNFADIDQIAQYIIDLREKTDIYRGMRKSARDFACGKFSKESHCKALIESYQKSIESIYK